jgi:hypothetical protein
MDDFQDKLSRGLRAYFVIWDSFRKDNKLTKYIPNTVGWKAEDIDEFNNILGLLLSSSVVNQCHIGYVDERYIASIVFHEPIHKNIYILKLMQKRTGSSDPSGLDHVDFFVNQLRNVEDEFNNRSIGNWEYESNEAHKWISLKFEGTEAKFVDHIVLDVCVTELKNVSAKLGFKSREV